MCCRLSGQAAFFVARLSVSAQGAYLSNPSFIQLSVRDEMSDEMSDEMRDSGGFLRRAEKRLPQK